MNYFFFTILLFISLSCGTSKPQESESTMYGSQTLSPQDPGYNSSVAIKSDNRLFNVCSGVLVAKNLVATAAHCVKSDLIDLTDLESNASFIHFSGNSSETPPDFIRRIVEIKTHPEYNPRKSANLYDIAWIKFVGDVPSGYEPASVLRNMDIIPENAAMIYTGHGLRENEYSGNIRLKSFGIYKPNVEDPQRMHGVFMSKIKTSGIGPCSGDSGGPAFVKHNNRWYVAGVLSGTFFVRNAEIGCGRGYLTHNSLVYYGSWIESTSGILLNR